MRVLLVVYVDDFKLAGPTTGVTKGWALLRRGFSIETEERVLSNGTTYLGCKQFQSTHRRASGQVATALTYDMSNFVDSCIDRYKQLSNAKEVKPAPNEIPRHG